jgi:KUP system potassium uptake protein
MILWGACSVIVLTFRTSTHMEAAYGLSITVTMLMTTFLLYHYLLQNGTSKILAGLMLVFFGTLEGFFFISSVTKFFHGGFVAVAMALLILSVMYIWYCSNRVQEKASQDVQFKDYLPQLQELHDDDKIPYYQTNVVFLVPRLEGDTIPQQFIYSILDKRLKRAKVYWFVNVEVTDEPYTEEYSVDMMGTDFIVKVKLYLGFRIAQDVNVYLRQIIHDLMKQGRLPKQPQHYSLTPGRQVGDFRFVIINEELSNMTRIDKWDRQVMQARLAIKRHTVTPERWFGIEYSEVTYETVPLIVGETRKTWLKERKR